ncbi:TIM barrel protein [Pseudomonas sp. C27(2019)]|uniref:hydroxypyruvate isomerase family protein n=1 Tax=Pseudomonas sp. C27(2019) TaxID=2604941 RepID=UPI0012464014|nr:TIM barrel protein [Pseudomonas sp. C27(2019)]QEY58877.1 TIM barrel protein [Pseudomonas sp. C27(2019)]
MEIVANLSMLFTELPVLQRVRAAKAAGFAGVEIQFPYAVPALQLKEELERCAMPLLLINLPAGDLMQGGNGIACDPQTRPQFAEALDEALSYALMVRPRMVNVLAGRLAEGASRGRALATLAANLREAAQAFDRLHIKVLCEAINPLDMPGFLINTPQHLYDLLTEVKHANCFAQLDVYHMARQGIGIEQALAVLGDKVAHVQFADCPGRGEPGTGQVDFVAMAQVLQQAGYTGALAAEYRPNNSTQSSLAWLQRAPFAR